MRWAIFTNHDEGASKRWSLDKAAQFNARTVANKKKLNLERVPIKRIVTSNEPNRQNSGERTDKCVKWRTERKDGRTLPHRTSSGWDPPKSSSHRTEVQILVPTPHLHFGAITGQQRCWPRVCVSATNAGSDSRPREGGSSDHSTALWTNNAENSSPQGQALLTLPDRLCEVGSNKIGPDRNVGNQRRQFELARQQRASQEPSSLLRRQRCSRREIAQRRGVGLFSRRSGLKEGFAPKTLGAAKRLRLPL